MESQWSCSEKTPQSLTRTTYSVRRVELLEGYVLWTVHILYRWLISFSFGSHSRSSYKLNNMALIISAPEISRELSEMITLAKPKSFADLVAFVVFLLLSCFYLSRGKAWDRQDPLHHLWFERPQNQSVVRHEWWMLADARRPRVPRARTLIRPSIRKTRQCFIRQDCASLGLAYRQVYKGIQREARQSHLGRQIQR